MKRGAEVLAAETRTINKCVYTQVRNSPDGGDDLPAFIPLRGFAKVGLLATVLDDAAISKYVLAAIRRDAAEQGIRRVDDLASAAEEIWRDDPRAAARILGDIEVEDVARFAEAVVVVQAEMVREARADVEESIATVLDRTRRDETEREEQRRSVREQLEAAEAAVRAHVVAPFRAPESTAVAGDRGHRAPDGLTRVEVVADLRQRHPESAAVLDALDPGVFTPMLAGTYGGIGDLVVPFTLHGYVTQQKAKTVRSLIEGLKVEPLGFLHLERLQFTPVGYVRGELVYSLPMAPGEIVRLSHREWTRTEEEFEELVATSLETASEESLGEKSELTESFNSQQQHNSAFNASVTASGGFGPVQISTSVGYNASNASSQSRQASSQHSQEITKKASSRAKSEHKITLKVTSIHEMEETSFREIANLLERPVRWDFHRLMRKWRIDLFRYDMRMTYDIVVPEPGSYLLRRHLQLRNVEQALAQPFVMPITPANITRGTPGAEDAGDWAVLSNQYGVSLPKPPPEEEPVQVTEPVKFSTQQRGDGFVELTLPEGYAFKSWLGHDRQYEKQVLDDDNTWPFQFGSIDTLNGENSARLNGPFGKSNTYEWRYLYYWDTAHPQGYKVEPNDTMFVHVEAVGRLTDDAFREWQMRCFELLRDALQMRYEEKRDLLEKLRDSLVQELGREDALMLRKLEKEEIMKAVLRWVLGPDFRFYPQHLLDLPDLTLDPNGYLQYYGPGSNPFEPGSGNVREVYHEPALRHGEIVKFLHHAIEWENVNYVLYPYFWTDEPRWDFKQSLFHSDYVHRGFLRSGSARVVLTIRPGFEKSFLEWVEGFDEGAMPAGYPYETIADEVEQMAKTSYPYTQDANVEMERVLCRWDEVPGDDTAHLLHFLAEDLYLRWAADADVEKDASGRKLLISARVGRTAADRADITLDEDAGSAVLTISPSRVYDLKVRRDDDGWRVLFQPNWVDTWYEFTPTGALDIAEGQVLP
jgi:hypothetical protein